MELEDYLIDEYYSILALSRISQIICKYFDLNYAKFVKEKSDIDEVLSLIRAIQLIVYAMRCRRNEYYKKIDSEYADDLTYDSVIYDEF